MKKIRKIRILDLWARWSFVRYKNLDRSFFRFVAIHAFDRQTVGRTDKQLSHRETASAFDAAR